MPPGGILYHVRDVSMSIYKNKPFTQWATKLGIKDSDLITAIVEMTKGLCGANLGGNVYKKRIAFGHRGKSSGVRTIIAFKVNDKAFFIYGFSKNKLDNITKKEEEALKYLAKIYFGYDDSQIHKAIKLGELSEVKYEKINS
jgi:hypothetical protein